METNDRRALIQLALGKASVAFMSQPTGGQIVMPTEDLLETAEDILLFWERDVAELRAENADLRDQVQTMLDGRKEG